MAACLSRHDHARMALEIGDVVLEHFASGGVRRWVVEDVEAAGTGIRYVRLVEDRGGERVMHESVILAAQRMAVVGR